MMNSEEIFEEYTKATAKRRYIAGKAAELGVKESDIICELFKSGYKFEEIRRANKGIYNAGMKKYEKWLKNGSPENEEADAPESHCPENDTTEQENEEKPEYEYPATDEAETAENLEPQLRQIIAALRYKNDKLEVKLKSLASENVELKAENSKLEKDIEIQNGHIKTLENRLIGSQAYDDVCEENKQLKNEKQQFMDRIDELEENLRTVREQLRDLDICYMGAMQENEKIRKSAEIDAADLESEQEHLKKVYQENEGLKKRLERAERYILNTIYEQFEDRDDEDGEV